MKMFKNTLKIDQSEKIINDKINEIFADEKFVKHLFDLGFNEEAIKENAVFIVDYFNDFKVCANCKNVQNCERGEHYIRKILYKDEMLTFEYDICDKYKKINKVKNLSSICDISDDLLTKTVNGDIQKTAIRKNLILELVDSVKSYKGKNIFVESKKNSGATFITSIFYKEIISRNSLTGNYLLSSKRFNELSENIFNNKAEFAKKMEDLSNCEVLVLNKLSNFNFNEFTRNHILYPILEQRISNNLTTIITSELKFDDFLLLLNVKNTNKDVRFNQIKEMLTDFKQFNISTNIKVF